MSNDVSVDAGVLGDEHRFDVTDQDGTAHNLGPLVNQLLTIRRQRRTGTSDTGTQPSGDIFAGVETGIRMAVQTLFGTDAEKAFARHCDEVERFLNDSDTARH